MILVKYLWRIFMLARKGHGVRGTIAMIRTAPRQAALVAGLLKDTRVPAVAKALLVGAGIFAVSPLNAPGWIPVIGALDDIGIGLLALNLFFRMIPGDLLSEHRQVLGLEPKSVRVGNGRR
jgi:uncharacterized membrane protein YkvA (DUF1232 family)